MLSLIPLAAEDGVRWHPGIGDPTAIGWLTVVAYLVATYLCFRAAQSSQTGVGKLREINPREAGHQHRLARFWLGLSVLMLLLGINKQLDLQTLFTEIGRRLARAEGWYGERRKVQIFFILAIGVSGLAAIAGVALVYRRVLGRIRLALVGISGLLAFIVIRAASFNHVNLLLFAGPVRLNWVLELGGISVVALAAYRAVPAVGSGTG